MHSGEMSTRRRSILVFLVLVLMLIIDVSCLFGLSSHVGTGVKQALA